MTSPRARFGRLSCLSLLLALAGTSDSTGPAASSVSGTSYRTATVTVNDKTPAVNYRGQESKRLVFCSSDNSTRAPGRS